MSLMPIYFSTNNTKKRKSNKKLNNLNKEHREFINSLKKLKMPLPLEKEKKVIIKEPEIPSGELIPTGIASKVEQKTYSGSRKLIGIATMHKSNMVPVFSNTDAQDIAQMRRN